ncbi:MAG TPA: PEGA domain-containing protein [Candidatus Saccharibacteria bacterium]|nr:PEGA domain-containing protein [Candidatus Saccharibacteria bacterium]
MPVEIAMHPSDAKVTVNDETHSSGTVYLKPGDYTLIAKREGWDDATTTVSVKDEPRSIALVLEPNSQEARELLENESVITEREALAGIAANARGEDIRAKTPILSKLPYSDIFGPFKIDFGFNQDDNRTPYFIVSFATAKGRRLAIEWLKKQEVDLVKTEVIFEGLNNPFSNLEVSHADE